MQSYILLKCEPGTEKEIITKLKQIPEVVEINGIWGIYDVFVKVSSLDPFGADKILKKIRSIKQITQTDTMPVLYGQGGSIDEEPRD